MLDFVGSYYSILLVAMLLAGVPQAVRNPLQVKKQTGMRRLTLAHLIIACAAGGAGHNVLHYVDASG